MTSNVHPFSLNIENLSKRFSREWIFRNVTYQFTSGNTYAITGPNGSGKSTLLQVLWGQVPQTSGNLSYFVSSKKIATDEIARHVSIATPYMDLIDEFTLEEQLKFHFSLKEKRGEHTITDLLQILYLEDQRNKFIGNFSSGMKQRVKLGLAFYTKAALLFLDEPGSHLDERAFQWYLSEFSNLPKESMVFIGSNNPAEYPQNAVRINLPELKQR